MNIINNTNNSVTFSKHYEANLAIINFKKNKHEN